MAALDPSTMLPLFQPAGLLLVVGGSVLVAALHGTARDFTDGLAALGRIRRSTFDEDGARAEIAQIDRVARKRGVIAIEDEAVTDPVLAAARDLVADGAYAELVEAHFAAARRKREAAAARPQSFWVTLADVAPAIGMIGTILGLAGMFAAMDDPARIGPAMAIALLTTLYGAILANAVASPIAARIGRAAAMEEEARARVEPFFTALTAIDRTPARPRRQAA
jgi:chemotaxis protein MotA